MPGSILLNSSVADIGMLWYATQYATFVSALVTPSMALLPWAMYWPIPPVVAVVVTLGDVLANPTRRCRRCYLGRCTGQSHPSLPSLSPWAMYWPIPPVVAVVVTLGDVLANPTRRCRRCHLGRCTGQSHPSLPSLLPWAMYWPIPPVVAVVVTLGDVLANPTRRCRRCYLGRCTGQSHPSLPSLPSTIDGVDVAFQIRPPTRCYREITRA